LTGERYITGIKKYGRIRIFGVKKKKKEHERI